MNEQEFQALVSKIESSIGVTMDTKLKDGLKGLDPAILKAVSEDSVELQKTVKEMNEANTKLVEAQKAQSGVIEELRTKLERKEDTNVPFDIQLKTLLNENKAALVAMKNGDSKSNIRMTIKAVGNMLVSTNITGQIPLAEREGGITRIVQRQPFLLDIMNVGSITSNLWEWVQQANKDGAAGMTAEGVKKNQIDFDLVLASATVRKVTAFIKVSKEMLDDVALIQSEIDQELKEQINLVIDAQLLSGNGAGQNLVGVLQNAVAFAPGIFATAAASPVVLPTNQDVLRVAINQIRIAQFQPNYIVMHPSDATSMDLSKLASGAYILPPFSTNANTVIKGIPVITNTGMTIGTYLVGDFTKSGVRIREGLTFDVGYENDDFTKNFVTILAEARLVHRVKSNHFNAFVTGTFATDIAAIKKA